MMLLGAIQDTGLPGCRAESGLSPQKLLAAHHGTPQRHRGRIRRSEIQQRLLCLLAYYYVLLCNSPPSLALMYHCSSSLNTRSDRLKYVPKYVLLLGTIFSQDSRQAQLSSPARRPPRRRRGSLSL
jgi:hypothetical protein